MKKDARVMQIAAACSENHSGPFSDAFFGLGVAEWCDFSVLVAFQRPPVFRSDSTKKRYSTFFLESLGGTRAGRWKTTYLEKSHHTASSVASEAVQCPRPS